MRDVLKVNFIVSLWCNYSCHYCGQNHTKQGRHGFSRYPVEDWIDRFKLHKEVPMTISLTGGEPLLDYNNMEKFMRYATGAENITKIGVGTNGSPNTGYFKDMDTSKVRLNVSFHQDHVTIDQFEEQVFTLLGNGLVVNFITCPVRLRTYDSFLECKERFKKIGIAVLPNVITGKTADKKEDYDLLWSLVSGKEIDSQISEIRSGKKSSKGGLCKYPTSSILITQTATMYFRCPTSKAGNFMVDELPLDVLNGEYIPCPAENCPCIGTMKFRKDLADRKTLLLDKGED